MSAEVCNKERRLGDYILKRSLGEGGSGQVFLAWKPNITGKPLICATKCLLQRHALNEESCHRSLQEAQMAISLGAHPNIVQVIDVDVHQGMPFIVMEYIDGVDLHVLLEHKRKIKQGLPFPAVYDVLASIAAALHHAHCGATIDGEPVGVIHRDVKPANILISRDGVAKLTDFGIGVIIEEGTAGQHWRGTARYMSPEHLRCDARPEMDIYALGVVAWEMVENREYREGLRGTQHHTAIMDGEIPPMRNDETPRELASIIDSCLKPSPQQRPSADELLKMLGRCPGFGRDPSFLKYEIVSMLGTRRRSGATQQEFAATPELIATYAVLDHANESQGGSDTNAVSLRAKVDLDGLSDSKTPVLPEQDAPRLFRRKRAPKLSKTSELAVVAGKFEKAPQTTKPAKTPPIAAPWGEGEGDRAEPRDLAARGKTEPGPLMGGATPSPRWQPPVMAAEGRRPTTRGTFLLPTGVGVAAALVAALLTAHGLGAFNPAAPVETVPLTSISKELPTAVAEELPTAAAEVPPAAVAEELPEAAAEVPPVAVADESPTVAAANSRPPKKPKKAAPPARVSLTLVLFLVDAVELKIGRKTFMVERKVKVDVPAGRLRVKWRLPGEKDWHDEGRQKFSPEHHYVVRLHSERAPEVIDTTRNGGTK